MAGDSALVEKVQNLAESKWNLNPFLKLKLKSQSFQLNWFPEASDFLAWWRPPAQLMAMSADCLLSLTAEATLPPEESWQNS